MNLSYIPAPEGPLYSEQGEVRRRLCRVLHYIALQYNFHQPGLTWREYQDVYVILLRAWDSLNADSEFTEQIPIV